MPNAATLSRRRHRGGSVADPYGILVEPQRTNYLYENTDFSLWTVQTNITLVAGQALRASTYGHLVSTSNSASELANPTALPGPTSGAHVVSVYWKKGTSGRTIVNVRDHTSANQIRLTIEPTAGAAPTVSASAAGGATNPGASFYAIGDTGWYRCYAYADLVAASFFDVWIQIDALGTGNVYLALPQLEEGRTPTSPILAPTAAAVTRAIDYAYRNVASGVTGDWSYLVRMTLLARHAYHVADFRQAELANTVGGQYGGVAQLNADVDRIDFIPPGANATGTQTITANRHLKTLYSMRRTATTVESRINKAANGTYGAISDQHNFFYAIGHAIIFALGHYDSDLGDAAIDAAQDGAFPPGDVLGASFDGTLPTGWLHSRTSSAVAEDFSTVASNIPRFVRLPF